MSVLSGVGVAGLRYVGEAVWLGVDVSPYFILFKCGPHFGCDSFLISLPLLSRFPFTAHSYCRILLPGPTYASPS